MVVIDGFSLLFLPGGIKSYLIALLKALDASEQAKKTHFVVLLPKIDTHVGAFYQKEVQELEGSMHAHFRFQYVKINPILFAFFRVIHASDAFIRRYTLFLWEHYYVPQAVRKLQPKVVLHPYQAVSNYKTAAKKVVVIHDIFHWVENQQYSFIVKFLYNTFKKGCAEADTIVTISKSSKDEIVRYLGADEKKVVVCYEGVDDLFLTFTPSADKTKEIIQYYHLPQKYIFGLASPREYKNSKGILEVFRILSKKDPELRLVLVGWMLASNNPLTAYIHAHQLEGKVIIIPRVRGQEDLLYLYHLSYLFLFPSYKEGFGLPPLEAIACGTLAVVSNVSAIGEIYNGILPSFDPEDYQGIADYILALTPKQRQDAITLAREKLLPTYTWKHVLPKYLTYLS